ncbi:hypothetical protein BaRGS_00035763, partial [Batillaria attramentaria]
APLEQISEKMAGLCPSNDNLELGDLPDSLLLEVFSFLEAEQLGTVARTCSRFCRVVRDELLWKNLFYRHYKIPLSVPMHPRASSWRGEFERLHDHSPSVLCQVVQQHKDQVLHISFSHNGQMFATSSKDGRIMVWNAEYPCRLRFSANMTKDFSWRYTQYSQFNKSDTLLLVSGVHYGNMNTSGEIAVFDLQAEFEPQCRVVNKPYDVFGTWYDNQHLLSGTLYWTGHLNSISALWLNKASQAVESERESVMMCLYRFQNINASSIRTIMVADCPVPSSSSKGGAVCEKCGKPQFTPRTSLQLRSENRNANNSSVCDDVSRLDVNHHVTNERDGSSSEDSSSEDRRVSGAMEWKTDDEDMDVDDCYYCWSLQEGVGTGDETATSKCDTNNPDEGSSTQPKLSKPRQGRCPFHSPSPPKFPRRRQDCGQGLPRGRSDSAKSATPAESWCRCQKDFSAKSEIDTKHNEEKQKKLSAPVSAIPSCPPSAANPPPQASASTAKDPPLREVASVPCVSGSIDPPSKKPESTEKLLIFTMGEETYTPHLIGIKRMRLQDVLGERAENGELDPAGEVRLLPNVDENLQGMDRPRDDVDHMINMHGHIVGMALSPDHRYLYVNSRQWPQNYSIQKVLEPPPIAQEIDIHVIDLQTLTEVGTIMRSHKAYTPNDECFFLFLDISDRYVASGAEDKHGYLWDRHYGVCLNRFPHDDVVNSVAFNPKDEEMLVTVSDDFKIKIWRSRRWMRDRGLSPATSDSPSPSQ